MLKLIRTIQSTLRYKMLVLVLFPIVLIMPIALVLAIYMKNEKKTEKEK